MYRSIPLLRAYREAVGTLEREYQALLAKNQEDVQLYLDETGQMRPEYALYRKCNVCGGSQKRTIFRPNPYTYVECVRCGFRFMDPIIDPSKTEILSRGISDYRRLVAEDPRMETRMLRETQQVRDVLRLKSSGALLDVGCGLGRHLSVLQKHFQRAEGVELCAASVQFCRARGLVVHDAPLEELALPAETYDVIMMSQVLEHLPDPRRTCQEVRRLLKPDGVFYVDTPNFTSLSVKLFGNQNALVIGSSHISLFNVASLEKLLQSLDLEVASAKTYQTDLFPVDVGCFVLSPVRFRHRRNLHVPLYLLFYRAFHVIFEEGLCRNLGTRWGAYLRLVARKRRA